MKRYMIRVLYFYRAIQSIILRYQEQYCNKCFELKRLKLLCETIRNHFHSYSSNSIPLLLQDVQLLHCSRSEIVAVVVGTRWLMRYGSTLDVVMTSRDLSVHNVTYTKTTISTPTPLRKLYWNSLSHTNLSVLYSIKLAIFSKYNLH